MKNERDYLNLAIAIGKLKSEDIRRAERLGIDSRRLLGMVRSCEKEKWKLPAPLFLKYCEENRKGKISIKAFLKKEGLTKKDIIKAKKNNRKQPIRVCGHKEKSVVE